LDYEGQEIPFYEKELNEVMTLSYGLTSYAAQGITIKNKYCIFDVMHPHADLTCLYVNLSRSTELKNVYFYMKSMKDDNEKRLNKILMNKIDSYKNQDLKSGRGIDKDNYIDLQYFKKLIEKQKSKCFICDDTLELETSNDNLMSLDRLNNKFGHVKNNCVICCVMCNKKKSNK